jgi:hypothetical protein
LGGPVATKTNDPFAINGCDVALPQMSLEHIEGRGLGAARGLAYIAHVVDMKVDEFADSFHPRYTGPTCRSVSVAQRRASSRRRKVSLT